MEISFLFIQISIFVRAGRLHAHPTRNAPIINTATAVNAKADSNALGPLWKTHSGRPVNPLQIMQLSSSYFALYLVQRYAKEVYVSSTQLGGEGSCNTKFSWAQYLLWKIRKHSIWKILKFLALFSVITEILVDLIFTHIPLMSKRISL